MTSINAEKKIIYINTFLIIVNFCSSNGDYEAYPVQGGISLKESEMALPNNYIPEIKVKTWPINEADGTSGCLLKHQDVRNNCPIIIFHYLQIKI